MDTLTDLLLVVLVVVAVAAALELRRLRRRKARATSLASAFLLVRVRVKGAPEFPVTFLGRADAPMRRYRQAFRGAEIYAVAEGRA